MNDCLMLASTELVLGRYRPDKTVMLISPPCYMATMGQFDMPSPGS